jgi:trehalose/maltose hydrolase-like predicted phosphorylase
MAWTSVLEAFGTQYLQPFYRLIFLDIENGCRKNYRSGSRDELNIKPNLPSAWDQVSIRRFYRGRDCLTRIKRNPCGEPIYEATAQSAPTSSI